MDMICSTGNWREWEAGSRLSIEGLALGGGDIVVGG